MFKRTLGLRCSGILTAVFLLSGCETVPPAGNPTDNTNEAPTFSIQGRVIALDGKGASKINVSATIEEGDPVAVSTDDDGTFSITGLSSGSYVVAASGGDLLFDPAMTTVEITDADVTDIEFQGLERHLAIVLASSLENDLTTPDTTLPISGQLLVLDGGPMPTRLKWDRTPGEKSKSGEIEVNESGQWSGDVPLVKGDNNVQISSAVSQATAELRVTLNKGYTFGGQLAMSPDVAYVSEPRQITANIALTDANTDPASVQLVRLDEDGKETEVATLTDNGDLLNGDEIDGDSIFSARFTLDETEESDARFRVVVTRLDSSDRPKSEIFNLLVTSHLTPEELTELLEKQANLQARLDDLTDEAEILAEVADIIKELEDDPLVEQVGPSDSGLGVWIIYKSGIAATLYAPAGSIKGGSKGGPAVSTVARGVHAPPPVLDSSPNRYEHFFKSHTPAGGAARPINGKNSQRAAEGDNVIGSNKARIIAAQFFDWGDNDDIPKMDDKLVNDSCFEITRSYYEVEGGGSVEDFKHFGDYGIVLISSHGDSFYKGILSLWAKKFGWNGPFGQVILHTNAAITEQNFPTYEDDCKAGRLIFWGAHYGITPPFIRHYSGAMPNTLVYMSICRGSWNGTLAQSFLDLGAGAFFGYSDYVAVSFCESTGTKLLDELLEPGNTVAEAFTPGLKETDKDPAEFRHFGAMDLSIQVEGLQDGSFENNSIGQSWSVSGDARIIPFLGVDGPTDGSFMAVISTGLGFTDSSGTLSQQLCLPGDPTTLSFDWNFYSEEFLEYVGSQFQDSFSATIYSVDDPSNSATLLFRAIDDLGGSVGPVPNSFDRGDVYATGWQHFEAPIPDSLLGQKVQIQFYATDIGDSIYDTAVLIDNIRIGEVE